MLTDPAVTGPVEPGQVQFALVGRDLARLGRELQTDVMATGLTLRV
jgi:hypothetical protein